MGLILWLACHVDPSPGPAELSPTELYTRASLDVRGVRPTLAELDAIGLLATPDAVDAALDGLLLDGRFEERVRSIYADIYLTRQDAWVVTAASVGLDDEAAFAQAAGEEPLALIARVAAEDKPWTDIVTADWTLVDETLAAAWPVDYPAGQAGWQAVHYTDGRPPGGVLATNGFWWRYTTTESNMNRGRANAVARLLLCEDFLAYDVPFDRTVDLSSDEAVKEAIATNPSCVYCHKSLDPLASHFYGYYYQFEEDPLEHLTWHPERQYTWQQYSGVAPGYYGAPSTGMAELPGHIASDNRFVTCAVRQAWHTLLQREPTAEDETALVGHRDDFIHGGLTLRALYRSMFRDPAYRAAESEADATRKLASPDLLAAQVEGLTGYRLREDGWDLFRNDAIGVRALAGGADGHFVVTNASRPNPTTLLVQERLAEAAASYVVAEDQAHPDAPRLFTRLSWTETPGTDAATFTAQVRDLHRAVLGSEPDGTESADLVALWSDLYAADGDIPAAWTGVLTALLRDPAFVIY